MAFDDPGAIEKDCQYRWDRIAQDKDGNLVYLAESAWIIKSLQQDYRDIRFHSTSELRREMQEAGQVRCGDREKNSMPQALLSTATFFLLVLMGEMVGPDGVTPRSELALLRS